MNSVPNYTIQEPANQPAPPERLTEIVLPNALGKGAIVLPMLAHLSRENSDRWFTWITEELIHKKTLEEYGFDLNKVRVIHSQSKEYAHWVFWEGLNNGNSSTVIATLDKLKDDELKTLELAAQNGNCRGLILRYR